MDDPLVDLIHSKGPLACDGIAFHMTHRPTPGEPVHTFDVWLVDGGRPSHGDPMLCGTCQRAITPGDVTPAGGWA